MRPRPVSGNVGPIRSPLALVLCWLALAPIVVLPPHVYAHLPTGAHVVHGQVNITSTAGAMSLQQTSRNAIVNWQTFNIGAANSVRIEQGGADAAMLARVVGGDPSRLLGALKTDGKFFLINPRGVVVGEGATIDTAGFLASTLDVSDQEFLAGGAMTFRGDSGAGIVNLGRITAREGSVMLLAHTVKNAGGISAPGGTAALAAGSEILLTSDHSSVVVKLNLPATTEKTGVENSGVIAAAQAELKAAGGSLYDLAVNQSGFVEATGVEHRNGRVILTAAGGTVGVSGSVTARNADGSGGEILVGGDYRGGNADVPNAVRTVVTSTAKLDASAVTAGGAAGRAIVWADDSTRFLGTLEAQGAGGGFAEVSGKRFLDFNPAATVQLGAGGTLLLDPDALVISADPDSDTATSGTDPFIFSAVATPATLNVTTLQDQLAVSNVILDTSSSAGDVQFNAAVTWSTDRSLRVNAGGSIYFNASLNATDADSALSLYAGRYATDNSGQGNHLTPRVELQGSAITVGTLTYGANALSAPAGYTVDATHRTGNALLDGTLDVGKLTIDLSGGAAGVFANDPNNAIGTFNTTGTGDLTQVVITDSAGDLNVKVTSAGSSASQIRIVTPGALTLQTGTALSFAAQADVVLASTGGAFVNNAGAGAIGANGRFLIYSNAPASTAKGGLSGTDVFSHPYDAGDNFADTTSRFLFSAVSGGAPTLVYRADNKTRGYGDANPTLTFGVTGFESGVPDDVTGAPALSLGGVTQSSGVGSYTITIGQGTLASGNYAFTFANGSLSITPASLVIAPKDAARLYGEANPGFDGSFSGLKNGENGWSVVNGLSLETSATSSSGAGTYAITASGASADNYSISYGGSGTLTINKAPLTVTASSALTKTYGEANPNLFVGLSTSGLRNGDDIDQAVPNLDFDTTATTSSPVGTYAVNGSGTSANYDVTFAPGLLTISKALLTIAANDATRLYGDANPAFTSTISGLRNGDAASIVSGVSLSTTATPASPVGTYAIVASGATVASANYDVAYAPGTLTVNPAPLTATIADATRTYGAANPVFGATFSGWKNGDTASAVSGLVFHTTANAGSDVGTYPITGSASASSNYALTFVPGTLTVDPAILTLTPRATAAFVYGDTTAPRFAFDASGFVNGDGLAAFNAFGIAYEHGVTSSSAAGSYAITMTGGSMRNYTIVHQPGTLVVQKAPLTVVPHSFTRTYGAANPVFTATYTGLRNGDTAASLASEISFITSANVRSSVGNYAINGQGSARNYALTFGVGTLTITPATLIVTPGPVTLAFGDTLPAFTYATSGWVAGDTPQAISGVTFNGPAASVTTEAPATYSLAIANPGTVASGNYTTVAGAPSTVEVTRRTVEVSGRALELPKGAAVSGLAADVSGLVPGGPQFTAEGSATADEVKTATVTHGTIVVTPRIVPASTTTQAEIDRYYDVKVEPFRVSFLADVEFLDPGKITLTDTVITLDTKLDPVTIDPELLKDSDPDVRLKYGSRVSSSGPLSSANLMEFFAVNGDAFKSLASDYVKTGEFQALESDQRAALESFIKGDLSAEALSQRMKDEPKIQSALMPLFIRYAQGLIQRGGTFDAIEGALVAQLSSSVADMREELGAKVGKAYADWKTMEDAKRTGGSMMGATMALMPDLVSNSYQEVINAALIGGAGGAALGTTAGLLLYNSKAVAMALCGEVAAFSSGSAAGAKGVASAVATAAGAAAPIAISVTVCVTLLVVGGMAMSESEKHQKEYESVMSRAAEIAHAEMGGGKWSLVDHKPETAADRAEVTLAMGQLFRTAFGS